MIALQAPDEVGGLVATATRGAIVTSAAVTTSYLPMLCERRDGRIGGEVLGEFDSRRLRRRDVVGPHCGTKRLRRRAFLSWTARTVVRLGKRGRPKKGEEKGDDITLTRGSTGRAYILARLTTSIRIDVSSDHARRSNGSVETWFRNVK